MNSGHPRPDDRRRCRLRYRPTQRAPGRAENNRIHRHLTHANRLRNTPRAALDTRGRLYGITVLAQPVSTGAITIDALPFHADTGRMASGDHVLRIQTDQLWLAVQQVPEEGAAIAGHHRGSRSAQDVDRLERSRAVQTE
jgi:hypothetical protein